MTEAPSAPAAAPLTAAVPEIIRSKASGPAVSAIVVCKDRLEQLQQTLPRLLAQPFHEVIVVDYDCPAGAGEWVARTYPAVKVEAVHGPPAFNLAIARNRGAAAASAPWLFFMDVDVLTQPTFLAAAIPRLTPGVFLIGDPLPPELWGTVFMQRAHFEAVSGYDEVFQGWGVEDTDMNQRLEALGVRKQTYDGTLAECIPHTDELRTRHHTIKDRYLNGAINEFYREVKRDLERQGVFLDVEGRRRVYDDIRRAFAAGRAPESFEVTFRQSTYWGTRWKTSLRFEFDARIPGPNVPPPAQAPSASASAAKSGTA